MGIERRLVTALSLLSELFEEALNVDIADDLGTIDREVLVCQADDAGRHVTNALFVHRPALAKLPPERRVAQLDRLFLRHPYELDCICASELEHLASLTDLAYGELVELLEHARHPTIRREVDFALSHLDVVLLVLDPEMYSRALETASADDRVRIAAQAEQVELMLDEARALTREDVL